MIKRLGVAAVVAAGWLMAAGAEERVALPREALETMRRVAIQHNGRNKPFDSFARETLQLITGAPRVGREDAVATVVSIMATPEAWQDIPLVSIPFIPLREALGLDRKTTHVSYDRLVATRALMRMLPAIARKQQQDEKLSMAESETMDAFQRFVALSGLLEQKLELVPPPTAGDQVWLPILEPAGYPPKEQEKIRRAWTELITAARTGPADAVTAAARQAVDVLRGLRPDAYPARWRLDLEASYHRLAPFRIARLLYLLAALGLFLGVSAPASRWARIGLAACWAAFLVHGSGIALRVILGGRPPVSNFFETTLWLPFVGVAIALVFERIYRTRYLALAASLLAAIVLVLADHLPLDSSISPVVAVLRSNLWLTIHVLTIVASYGALALATVLAHVHACLYLSRRGALASAKPGSPLRSRSFDSAKQGLRFGEAGHPSLPSLELFLYRLIQVGVVLLAGGIMLGAVWANASWGRYWGWDPKETWALITLLWFLAVLHGRFAGWISGVGLALSTIGGFFLLLMTYYGVSFYLVGLHSYAGGHATPPPPLLIGYLIAELAFLAWVSIAALTRRPRPG